MYIFIWIISFLHALFQDLKRSLLIVGYALQINLIQVSVWISIAYTPALIDVT
jgi:hypothetical protein